LDKAEGLKTYALKFWSGWM